MSKETGYKIKSAGKMRASIDMDGVIGWEIDSAQFKRDLKELGDVENIKITLNTEGGDVGQSVNIRNTIKDHPAKVHIHVVGYALSGGSYLLTGADKVTATDDSMIMIHEPWGAIQGTADEMRSRADGLDVMKDAVTTGYVEKMDSSEDEVKSMLKKTTWFTAAQAREIGLVDKIDSSDEQPAQMRSDSIDVTKYKNAPPEFLNRYAQMRSAENTNDGSAVETHEEGTNMTDEKKYSEAEMQAAIDKAVADAKTEAESPSNEAAQALAAMLNDDNATIERVRNAADMGLDAEQASKFMACMAAEANGKTADTKQSAKADDKPVTSADLLKQVMSMANRDTDKVNKNAATGDENDKPVAKFDAAAEYKRIKEAS